MLSLNFLLILKLWILSDDIGKLQEGDRVSYQVGSGRNPGKTEAQEVTPYILSCAKWKLEGYRGRKKLGKSILL